MSSEKNNKEKNGKEQNGIRFSSLFKPSHVICHTDKTNRDEIIHELLQKLAVEHGIGNVREAYDSVLERENDMPTVIGPHIAMPHARIDNVDSIVIGIATSKDGFAYTEESQETPTKLLILILVPKTSPGAYLQTLRSLTKILQDPEAVHNVAGLDSSEQVWNFFNRDGLVLPDHVHVYDIMDPVKAKLLETDTLEKAIDLFIRYGYTDIPVVDNEDELIGVVTTFELMRVCLPDYILWMDDLTPILNFEPFADILRNEGKTWLAEIMTSDYATISGNAPAIQAAKEITRHHTNRAYVVQDKKLVGVVSFKGFLQKIMRE